MLKGVAASIPIFSNSNNITFGTSNGTVTASVLGNAVVSYYENMPLQFPASTTMGVGVSTARVQPFVLPLRASVSFVRIPGSMSHVSTEVAGTSADTTFTMNRSYTDAVVFYSQGVGASSMSLRSVTSSLASWVFQTRVGGGTDGSQYTVSYNVTYPTLGGSGAYTTSYGVSSASYKFQSESMTLFTGPRFFDIPCAVSLSPGNYWVAFGRSTNFASDAGPANLSNASIGVSTIGVSQSNISWGYPGAATNNSIQVQPGLGIFTTNSAFFSTASIGLAQVSAVVSNPAVVFQMINRA